ncbi:class I SAM-dependent methyltransferase [Pelagibius sp.]|uniref:class I SAM-dependent methyltransferase n=1 Tax=Pelagibius sp. TaxID=1931238 RepID=UPI003B508A25
MALTETLIPAPDAGQQAMREVCGCPLCAGDAQEATPYAADGFAVVRCGACRLWYLSPRLPEAAMAEVYRSNTYFDGGGAGYERYDDQAVSLRLTFRRLLREMARRQLTGGSLLEVGCGYGFLLEEAAPYFSTREGSEYSPTAAARAAEVADRVYSGGLDAVPEDRRFDCIVACHVIEHVYEPVAFVKQIFRHLKPGGHCILAAPDMGGAWRKLMGRRWPLFKYPEHVVFYDADSLHRLMQNCGLTQLTRLPYPHAFPLAEVCRKLALPSPRAFETINIWLPGTTIAYSGSRPVEDGA